MRKWEKERVAASCVAAFSLAALAACADDFITVNPREVALTANRREVAICHIAGSAGTPLAVGLPSLPAHRAHGDYVTLLEVDNLGTTGDGIHFRRMTDALAAARAARIEHDETESARCRITIRVAPGIINGSTEESTNPTFERFPLVIDVPDITLQGALAMRVDAMGRATGASESGTTTFVPIPALRLRGSSSQTAISERTIIVNSHPTGSKGHGAIIEGFAFTSGRALTDTDVGGQGIGTFRSQRLVIRGNRFDGGFNSSIDLQASSALVERNYLSGLGSSCDICLAGPGDYEARDNRVIGGGIPGFLILPTGLFPVPEGVEPYTLPAAATVTAVVSNNEVTGHLRKPVGVGLRVGAVGLMASSVHGTSRVTFRDNNLVNNTFGMIIEAAFLTASGRRGDLEVTTSGNTFSQSCQADVLVSLANSQTAIGVASGLYLLNSTFDLTFGSDVDWDDVWFSHAASGVGNTLLVNGVAIANGSRAFYDATRVCP